MSYRDVKRSFFPTKLDEVDKSSEKMPSMLCLCQSLMCVDFKHMPHKISSAIGKVRTEIAINSFPLYLLQFLFFSLS